jgi:hypothetical protein
MGSGGLPREDLMPKTSRLKQTTPERQALKRFGVIRQCAPKGCGRHEDRVSAIRYR